MRVPNAFYGGSISFIFLMCICGCSSRVGIEGEAIVYTSRDNKYYVINLVDKVSPSVNIAHGIFMENTNKSRAVFIEKSSSGNLVGQHWSPSLSPINLDWRAEGSLTMTDGYCDVDLKIPDYKTHAFVEREAVKGRYKVIMMGELPYEIKDSSTWRH